MLNARERGQRVALFGVDALTDRAFGGNPAMVCLLPEPAAAFLHDRRLRRFTPAGELPVLATAIAVTVAVSLGGLSHG